MEISSKDHTRCSVVTIKGRLDSRTKEEFEASIKGLVEQGKKNIVLDMHEVDFLGSGALGVMIIAVNKLGAKIVIARPSERAVASLDVSGLDVKFTTYPTREDAVGSF